ncbi:hypothetical protein D2T29_10695 [Sinirhodobacter populi]|uniref:Uncharacterized protein n=1 Tax=Paenirhodobacter populi TaxID=2306993 RepID=A0A443KFG1_9RHOB|nr:hypothetical protein [Sinirhodobacter populi]RWR31492.1 hypothetical protein D2T29_10695 [Sinirhodobacter populi]
MTQPTFDLQDAAYDLLNGAQALRALRLELCGHGDGDPLRALERDHMSFVLAMMAEKAEACASAWIDEIETRRKKGGNAA